MYSNGYDMNKNRSKARAEIYECVSGMVEKFRANKRTGKNKDNGLGLPIERHGHAIEGEGGEYLSHDAEAGMFNSEPGVEDVLGLTQFPSRDGRPSVDALGRVRHGSCAHDGISPPSFVERSST